MEDHRDELVVILAGYTREMETFLTANSGLASRFPNRIEFPDYTAVELLQITQVLAKNKGYTLAEACTEPLLAIMPAGRQPMPAPPAMAALPGTHWKRPSSTRAAALWPSPPLPWI